MIDYKDLPDPWSHGLAHCDDCGHEWVAVWPLSADTLECPACGSTNTDRTQARDMLRAALAAEQPEPTEDDDTDRTIEEIADFFNEHGAEANEPTDAQIEAAADVTHDDFDALAVVDSYTRAAPEFDANVLRDFLSRYPQHANKLLFYAAWQLNSTPATPEEVEREEVSNDELLRMQSKVLKLLDKASPALAATHYCKDCGALWRQCDDYSFNLHLSARACPRCELESNATQLISLRDERERLRAVAEAHGSALQRVGTAVGLSAGADLHRELVPAIESLRRWAGKAAYMAAIKACEANAEHEEEARALQRADAARGGDENEELARLRHLSDVRLFNAGISTCAEAIRSLMQEQPK